MWHISSHPISPPVSGITCFMAKEKQSIEWPASRWVPPSSNRHPGPVTLKYYANPKHWSYWVTFCSGSDSKTRRPYCKCIFIGTIPACSVSQITVLKVQKYTSKATCQVKGARITDRRHLTGNPSGSGKRQGGGRRRRVYRVHVCEGVSTLKFIRDQLGWGRGGLERGIHARAHAVVQYSE